MAVIRRKEEARERKANRCCSRRLLLGKKSVSNENNESMGGGGVLLTNKMSCSTVPPFGYYCTPQAQEGSSYLRLTENMLCQVLYFEEKVFVCLKRFSIRLKSFAQEISVCRIFEVIFC